jgi:hypothetical protein
LRLWQLANCVRNVRLREASRQPELQLAFRLSRCGGQELAVVLFGQTIDEHLQRAQVHGAGSHQ